MNEEVKEVVETVEEVKEPTIDLSKFDKNKEQKVEKVDDVEALKAELEQEREKARKFKAAFDKKATEAASKTAELRDAKKESNEPIEKLTALELRLAEYELNEKKTNLTYGLTEKLGIGKSMAQELVSSVYNPETGEFSVGDFENSLIKLVEDIRDASYQKGYQTRDTEHASGKPRSLGSKEPQSAAERKRAEYLAMHKKR